MRRHEAKAAVIAINGLTAEAYRAWPVDGGVWLVEELVEEPDPSLRPSNDEQVWAVLPTGEVIRTTPGLQAKVSKSVIRGNQVPEGAPTSSSGSVPDRLESIFPELSQSMVEL